MRFTLSTLVVAVGLAGFGAAAQAVPAPSANPIGLGSSDVATVQMYGRMEDRMMRRRMMERRMERRMMERRMMRREMRRDMYRRGM